MSTIQLGRGLPLLNSLTFRCIIDIFCKAGKISNVIQALPKISS